MAEQTSIITLKGNVGKINFYKSRNGYQAREKGGVSKSRIMTDPRFARTRENIAEFRTNATSVKLLKDTIRPAIVKIGDSKLHQRLVRQLMTVLRTDPVNIRGERQVAEGNWALLQGLEMNSNASLSDSLKTGLSIADSTEDWEVSIPGFLPADYLAIPEGTTHFRVFAAGASLDFSTGDRAFLMDTTPSLPINQATLSLSLAVSKATLSHTHRVFLAGIEFMQNVNGQDYPLNNGAHNAASILKTERQ
ncbi:hypothetical protein [Negadavirga shengliensis]|uniref:Uncharacterized protein n=1 Tax=Negadavirga shengliensis TaxID=1389218 RepID=A0ABV9T8L3_9BACT